MADIFDCFFFFTVHNTYVRELLWKITFSDIKLLKPLKFTQLDLEEWLFQLVWRLELVLECEFSISMSNQSTKGMKKSLIWVTIPFLNRARFWTDSIFTELARLVVFTRRLDKWHTLRLKIRGILYTGIVLVRRPLAKDSFGSSTARFSHGGFKTSLKAREADCYQLCIVQRRIPSEFYPGLEGAWYLEKILAFSHY